MCRSRALCLWPGENLCHTEHCFGAGSLPSERVIKPRAPPLPSGPLGALPLAHRLPSSFGGRSQAPPFPGPPERVVPAVEHGLLALLLVWGGVLLLQQRSTGRACRSELLFAFSWARRGDRAVTKREMYPRKLLGLRSNLPTTCLTRLKWTIRWSFGYSQSHAAPTRFTTTTGTPPYSCHSHAPPTPSPCSH